MKITSKQDGVYPRTAAALAQQYDFGKVFNEITGIKLTVEEQEAMVKAELSLKLGYDDNDQIVSMLNASADIITIRGNRLTIDSDHFELTADGTIYATAGEIGGCVIKDGVLQIRAANIADKLTADQIDTQQFTAQIEAIEERVGDAEDRITNTNTSLTVLSGQIESKVSQTEFDTLNGTVTTHETKITQLPDQILLEVSATYATNDALNTGIASAESKITQTASEIRSDVSATYATQAGLNETNTRIDQQDDKIEAKVSQTEFDNLGNRVSTAESNITALSGEISARVTYTEFDSLGAEVAAVQGEISVKVDEENLISLINMAANEITITSASFSLSADGTISATAGYIGNFAIGDGIYSEQESLTGDGSEYPGVYIGTEGIGCGNGRFWVNSSGYLQAGEWHITGGYLSNDDGLYLYAGKSGPYIKLIKDASTETTIYPDSISTGSISLTGNITFGGLIYTKSPSDVSWSTGYDGHVDILTDIDERKRLTFKNGILTAVTSI